MIQSTEFPNNILPNNILNDGVVHWNGVVDLLNNASAGYRLKYGVVCTNQCKLI